MRLKAFQITSFRSIMDSGWVELENLTTLVGKNESGKTSLLRALHKFKPFTNEPYSLDREWPKGNRKDRDGKAVVCRVRFELTPEEQRELSQTVDVAVTTPFVLAKSYDGNITVELDAKVFPSRPLESKITEAKLTLDAVQPDTDEGLQRAFNKVSAELEAQAKDGRLMSVKDPTAWVKQQLAQIPEFVGNDVQTAIRANFGARLTTAITTLKGLPTIKKTISDYLLARIPTFIYMDDYRTFQGMARLNEVQGRKQQNQSSPEDKTLLMIMALSGLDLDNEVKKGSSDDINVKEQRQYDMSDAGLTLSNEIAERWRQRKYEVQFRADGYSFFTMVKDESGSYLIPLEDRSKGFQWFFSFDLLFMHESKGGFKGCVLLLDEPGLHLHPDAQRDLLARLEAYAQDNILVYSTHLPFMIDLRKPERIRTISETKDKGTVVDKDLNLSQPEAKFTLQAALGMTASQSHLIAQRNIVVEGVDDFWIASEFSDLMIRAGAEGLPDDVLITAAGGASEAAYVATLMIGQKLEVVVLLDSDKAGTDAASKLINSWLTRYNDAKVTVLKMADILGVTTEAAMEDVFDETYYLKKVEEFYAAPLKAAGVTSLVAPGTGQIVKRVEQALATHNITFNKGSVAKLIRKDLVKANKLTDLPGQTGERAKKLLTALNAPFIGG